MTTELHYIRLSTVMHHVRQSGARRVVDLGCGDGDLILHLLEEPAIKKVLGIELSANRLWQLRERLGDNQPRLELRQGSMLTIPQTLDNYDCAILLETIEHLDPRELSQLEQGLFARLAPHTVLITTPNADYNPLLGLADHQFRHPGHRFEWGRARFRRWAEGIARRHGYAVHCVDVGDTEVGYGAASQLAHFFRICGSAD
ncbi:MAG: class I SAM-dependent methyltransferase [Chromatiales bacterium]|nr:methyltransferase domain-containing protein [Gammaproteobacteria bacterium]MBW6475729.1 class I SAM-dependent methyltransferase [Chromatiales bacterium]